MRQYLVEGALGAVEFFPDKAKAVVSETRKDGLSVSRIPGRFSICDCVNGNNRRYSKRVWEKNLQNGSTLREAMGRNAAFGLLEHPKDGVVTLLSPISHHVTNADLKEARLADGKSVWEVQGEIEILQTPEGNKLKSLIEGGYNPLVSSRGYGSLQRAPDGVDEVCEDYVCEGWDVVIKPSFDTAQLEPSRPLSREQPAPAVESKSDAKPEPKQEEKARVEESPKIILKEESPSTGAVPLAAASAPTQVKTMQINEIKSRVTALRAAVESCTSDPSRINGLREDIDAIGREISQYRAADPAKNDWDAQKMHRDLEQLSTRLGETASAPAKQARKLSENNNKLMKVINAVAQTALTYKKKLGEALKTVASNSKMIEELTRRGQGWQRLAESRKAKFVTLEEDFNTACESLDLMAKRYHEDVTELGRRVIVLEFSEKAQAPEIQKLLKEASRLRHIVSIREQLEGKKPGEVVNEEGDKKAGVGKPAEGEAATMTKKSGTGKGEKGDKVADEPGKVTHESKEEKGEKKIVTEDKKDSAKEKVTEAKLVFSERDPRGINESVEMVRRLSTVTAK